MARFYGPDVLPVTQRTVSKHWMEHKHWPSTSGLASSFHPPLDSWS